MSDEGYAPKSPDLSSFYSEGPTPPAPQLSQSNKNHRLADYKSATSSLAYTTNYAPPSAATSAPSYVPPQQGNQQPQPHHNHSHNHNLYSLSHQPQSAPIHSDEGQHPAGIYPPPAQIHQLPLHYDQKFPSSHDYDYGLQQNPFQQPSYGQPYANHQSQPQPQLQPQPQTYHAVPSYPEPYAPPPLGATSLSPRFDQHQLPQQNHPATNMPPRKAPPPPPPVIEPSPVRTKFPTARIKRIMQADEEVGKVAQQTPIAVGKALELFMIQLVSKSADIARDKGSKRVSAQMLKQVVETDEQWDFLRDIVSRVEAEKEGSKGTKHKQESSSDEEMSEPKKRTRGPGRKKKTT